MSRGTDKIYNDFSRVIFETDFCLLDFPEKTFISRHVKEFRNYRKAISEKVRPILHRRPNGRDFEKINEWYYEGIPLNTVIGGINDSLGFSSHISSVYYFHPAILRRHSGANCPDPVSYSHPQRSNRWMYQEFCSWRENKGQKYFDPYEWGENPHGGWER